MKVEILHGSGAIGRSHEANANTMPATFVNGTEAQVSLDLPLAHSVARSILDMSCYVPFEIEPLLSMC
jgi:hypothetical protein